MDKYINQIPLEELIAIVEGKDIHEAQKYKCIFDLLPCGIKVIDEKGVVVVCNKANLDIFSVDKTHF